MKGSIASEAIHDEEVVRAKNSEYYLLKVISVWTYA